jgi:hypothetical protein
MYNISLIGIVTLSHPLYNEYILIKIFIIKKRHKTLDRNPELMVEKASEKLNKS